MTPAWQLRGAWRIGLLVLGALVALVALLPLAVALPLVLPGDAGLTAKSARGTIWSGTLRAARIADVPLGDSDVGLRFLALFLNEAQVEFRGAQLSGAVHAASGVRGASNLIGGLDVGSRFAPLPLSRVDFEGVTAAFRNGRCVRAEGRMRATLAGEIGGVALPGGLAGTIRCDGAALVLPLVGQSGMETLTIRMTEGGSWRATIGIRSVDPATAAKLSAAGFTVGQGGATLNLSGQL